jgi:hypothetical protein
LDQALLQWTGGYFEQFYNAHYAKNEADDHDKYRKMFIHYCQRFLSMGFHTCKFDSTRVYLGKPYYYQVGLSIFKVLSPWWEQQKKLRQDRDMAERKLKYVSPDAHKEGVANLSPAEKMQVFTQSLMNRNRIGQYNERGELNQEVVTYNKTTMPLIREFFQLNPDTTVQHLNLLLDRCLELPGEYWESELDPLFVSRKARNISLFMRNLHVIASQMKLLDELPAFTPLPPVEEGSEAQE